MNTTAPMMSISNLTKGGIYKFYVVSRNDQGTSLPSSILTLNVSKEAWNGVAVQGRNKPEEEYDNDFLKNNLYIWHLNLKEEE